MSAAPRGAYPPDYHDVMEKLRTTLTPDHVDAHYQLGELFWSIQGEGTHAGATAIFIRLQGCPVGCSWCDSKTTWYAGGERINLFALADRILQLPPAVWFVITGGEPLIYDLDPLLFMLYSIRPKRLVQLETSGAYPFKGHARPHHVTVSPKHAAHWAVAETVLHSASELKYVVDEHFDSQVAIKHLNDAALKHFCFPSVYLMPEGSPPRPEMIERTLHILRGMPEWNFGPRLQYAYPQIAAMEGRNNEIIGSDTAKALARAHRRQSIATEGSIHE